MGHGVSCCGSRKAAERPGKPAPLVLCGPSGAGKGTIIKELMKRHPGSFGFSVSHTTRQPRPGEVNGEHYHFTTRDKMQKEVDAGKFIEHALVHSNMYGTSIDAVEAVASDGRICVLDIDVQGVRSVKKSDLKPEPRYVFIMPPAKPTPIATLEQRLRGRGTESEEKLQERLKTAHNEIEYGKEMNGKNFDLVLVNDDLAKAVDELSSRIRDWEGVNAL